jgi:hypothetical protein
VFIGVYFTNISAKKTILKQVKLIIGDFTEMETFISFGGTGVPKV